MQRVSRPTWERTPRNPAHQLEAVPNWGLGSFAASLVSAAVLLGLAILQATETAPAGEGWMGTSIQPIGHSAPPDRSVADGPALDASTPDPATETVYLVASEVEQIALQFAAHEFGSPNLPSVLVVESSEEGRLLETLLYGLAMEAPQLSVVDLRR